MAALNSTTIRSNDQSVASSSVARTRCLPDPTVAPEHWVVVASLVETCKINDVDPFAHLTNVLTRIVNGAIQTATSTSYCPTSVMALGSIA
ncbi:transposase domain-containing protein [Bradyrhizobium diazoefficiens]|uniref:transposase domain-containing protein n=1 Tax=Bradyrhizobium diazoefficiens TaxID=1355477 RepID=UPI001FF0467E|nr:transposase domain-containing protein [Bradyrhizobium diazoefficiens]